MVARASCQSYLAETASACAEVYDTWASVRSRADAFPTLKRSVTRSKFSFATFSAASATSYCFFDFSRFKCAVVSSA